MIKILLIILMIIDHIGSGFYPDNVYLRIPALIARPLFIYIVSLGMRKTSDINNYKARLLALALVSTVPHILYFDNGLLNVIYTFFLTVCMIDAVYNNRLKEAYFLLAVAVINIDILGFGVFGIAGIIVFNYFNVEIKDINLNRWVMYIFYPLHLSILYLIKYIIY